MWLGSEVQSLEIEVCLTPSSRHSGPTSAFAPIAFALPPGADSAAPGVAGRTGAPGVEAPPDRVGRGAAKATEGESRGVRLGLAGRGRCPPTALKTGRRAGGAYWRAAAGAARATAGRAGGFRPRRGRRPLTASQAGQGGGGPLTGRGEARRVGVTRSWVTQGQLPEPPGGGYGTKIGQGSCPVNKKGFVSKPLLFLHRIKRLKLRHYTHDVLGFKLNIIAIAVDEGAFECP